MFFSKNFLKEIIVTCSKIDLTILEKIIKLISFTKKKNGRIFFLGVGGSAGNSSHAVNDFRKLANIECYSPTDNVSELTARINDEGWEYAYSDWLKISNIKSNDVIFFFSVGGGNIKKNVSINLINAAKFASKKKCKIISIVGKKDGYLYKNSSLSLFIPSLNKDLVTPISESFQSIIWHLLVSHPKIKKNNTKW